MDIRTGEREFDRILRQRDLRTVFQPVVHRESGAVAGYEALVRGPAGSPLESPEALLSAAHRAGRLVEFDWVARANACAAALDAGLYPDQLLFLNIEPISLDTDCPPDLWPCIDQAFRTFRIVLEVTERSLDRDPGTLLDGIERQRPRVAGIALDDVGLRPATLAMLPLVAPSVIKIDRYVVQDASPPEVAQALLAIREEAQRTGASILAEGVEAEEHLARAACLGAELGQGWLLGTPGALDAHAQRPRQVVRVRNVPPAAVASPFQSLPGPALGTVHTDFVVALTRQIGTCADAVAPTLHIALLPGAHLLDGAELDRLAGLVGEGTFCAVLGPGIPPEPGRGIRGVGQRRHEQPTDEWATIIIGPCVSAALVARRSPDRADFWQFGVTTDKERVIAAARSLVRLLGSPEPRFRYEL